jgi:hypothetical protein
MKIKVLCVICFLAGVTCLHGILKINQFYREIDCGFIKDHTTHAVLEDGDLVCLYRKQSYPYRVWGGRA